MIHASTEIQPVSDSYFRKHQDPVRFAAEITGVHLLRSFNTRPTEPLEVNIDQSAIDHMGWRPGDAITLVTLPPEGRGSEGKLIIRKALPGEIAFMLGDPPVLPEPSLNWESSEETQGPSFEWCLPAPWVETYFPGEYNEDYQGFDSETNRYWPLSDILGQAGQIELPLGPEKLFLYLQRSSPEPRTLEVHLVPGLLHLKGWSQSTPLVLESATDFDPFATEDVLTIREISLGEEPNLIPTSVGYTVEVDPHWLDRYIPDVYHPPGDHEPEEFKEKTSEIRPGKDLDVYRDTFVVGYSEMTLEGHTVSFEITPSQTDEN